MTAPPPALMISGAPPLRPGGGPLAWLFGGVAAMAATLVAVLFAAALAVVALLALTLALLALAAWRVRGGRGPRGPVIFARWTGYGWDARGG